MEVIMSAVAMFIIFPAVIYLLGELSVGFKV